MNIKHTVATAAALVALGIAGGALAQNSANSPQTATSPAADPTAAVPAA